MPHPSKSVARALAAVRDAADLLELAQRAVERARVELQGDALGVADRLWQQIAFLRKVAEVLRHEIERGERERRALASRSRAITDRPIG